MLSVIIPVYNSEKYLSRCLDSILAQNNCDYEIIIVNDGSTDGSSQICKEYDENNDNIIYIEKKNEGVVIARKVGLQNARGEYVTFVDADDSLEESCFKDIQNVIDKIENLDVIVFDYNVIRNNCKKIQRHTGFEGLYNKEKLKKEVYPILIHGEKRQIYRSSVVGSAYKREKLGKYLIDDARAVSGEDSATTVTFLYNASRVYYMKKSYYNYYINMDSVTHGAKVYGWENALAINSFIEHNINIDESDFKEQLKRKITHDLFNTCCSRYNQKKRYFDIRKEIILNLERPYYKEAIRNSHFRNMYYSIAKYCMLYKLCLVIYIINKLKRIINTYRN